MKNPSDFRSSLDDVISDIATVRNFNTLVTMAASDHQLTGEASEDIQSVTNNITDRLLEIREKLLAIVEEI